MVETALVLALFGIIVTLQGTVVGLVLWHNKRLRTIEEFVSLCKTRFEKIEKEQKVVKDKVDNLEATIAEQLSKLVVAINGGCKE